MRVLTQGYPLPPHVCYYCRTDRLPCVDLMRDDDDVHHRIEHIYLCFECIMHPAREIAPLVGWTIVRTGDLDELREQVSDLQSVVEQNERIAAAALAARDAIVQSLATNRQVEVEVTPEVVEALAYAPAPEPERVPARRSWRGALPERG